MLNKAIVKAKRVSRDMIELCQQHAIMVTFNQFINRSGTKGSEVPPQIRHVRADSRFNGFILYKTSDFLRFDAGGGCSNTWPALEMIGNVTDQRQVGSSFHLKTAACYFLVKTLGEAT